jgi:hypothetical protein
METRPLMLTRTEFHARTDAAGRAPLDEVEPVTDPSGNLDVVYRNLRTCANGLGSREAARRLVAYGANELVRRGGRRWPRELLGQLTQPLALLLAVAAILAALSGGLVLAVAILAVIVLNAVFAFVQEMHAEHAVEALAAYLPAQARVLRDAKPQPIAAANLVPGDILVAGSQVLVRDASLRADLTTGMLRALTVGLLAVVLGLGIAQLFGTDHGAVYAVLTASSSAALVLPIRDSLHLSGPDVLKV